jgi:ribosome-binding protein aMBF1 (putative translation factor)
MLTPEQLRAARALVGWSRDDLAKKSATSAETVKGFEGRGTDPKMGTVLKWKRALEVAGVIFIDSDAKSEEGGPGVRMRSQRRR